MLEQQFDSKNLRRMMKLLMMMMMMMMTPVE